MTIRDELLNLKNDDGMIVAEQAVEWARTHLQSNLHSALEWDNDKAGAHWRVWQIRQLVSIHIRNNDNVRQVVSLSIDRTNGHGGGYRDIDDVLARKDLRDVMLEDALAELDRIQAKYKTLQELAEVWVAKDAVKRRKRPTKAETASRQATA